MWSKDSVSDNINKGIILNMVCTVPDVADENYILPGSCMGQYLHSRNMIQTVTVILN